MTDIDLIRYQAPALSRGIDVLEILATEPEGLTSPELSRLLGLTNSQLFRILATLEHRGYIVRSDERYLTTLRLFAVAFRHSPTERLLALAGPVMRRLAEEVEQSSLLSVRNGACMIVVAFVPAPAVVSLVVPVGQQYPLLTSTAGLLHLAHEPASTRDALIAEVVGASPGELERERLRRLEELTGSRSYYEPSPDIEGVTNHTAVLCDCDHRPFASLTIPYVRWPRMRIGENAVHEGMVAAASRLETLMSGKPT